MSVKTRLSIVSIWTWHTWSDGKGDFFSQIALLKGVILSRLPYSRVQFWASCPTQGYTFVKMSITRSTFLVKNGQKITHIQLFYVYFGNLPKMRPFFKDLPYSRVILWRPSCPTQGYGFTQLRPHRYALSDRNAPPPPGGFMGVSMPCFLMTTVNTPCCH